MNNSRRVGAIQALPSNRHETIHKSSLTAESPRWERHDWLVLVAYFVLAHLIFYSALRPGFFLYGTDTTAHDFGLLLYNRSLIVGEGQLGLWNPYLFCGLPALGTFALCPFYPLTWLFAVLPAGLALTYQYILSDWLAGVWTYWAARWFGLKRAAASFAGLVFMVCGHVVTLAHAGHLQKVAAIAWIPLAFGCATAAWKERRWKPWVGCGVAIAAQLLASHVQIAFYTILFLLLWILWLVLVRRDAGGSPLEKMLEARSKRPENPADNLASDLLPLTSLWSACGLTLALLVAGGLSAAQILPALETTPLSNRGLGITFEEAAGTSYPPFEFIEYLLPSFLGDSAQSPKDYRGQWGTERIVTDYMGLLPVLLVFFGLAAGRNRDRWFWLAVVLMAAVLAAGCYTPIFGAVWRWLPGLSRFRSPGTIMVFIAWPAAILTALGLEEFTDRVRRDDSTRRRYLLILTTATIALAALFALLATPGIEWPWAGSIGSSLRRATDSRIMTLWASMRRSLLFASLACATLAAVAATARFSTSSKPALHFLGLGTVFVLAFLDPRLHESRYIKAADVRPFQLYLFSHWSDSVLQALPQPVRGIETDNEFTNRMMTRGIGSLHGYHPIHLLAYDDLLNLYAYKHPQLGRLVFEQFVLAPEGKPPGREYERRAAENGQVLWLRRPPLLYAYFPQEVEVVSDRQTLLAAMARPEFDPYLRSYTLDSALGYRATVGAQHAAPMSPSPGPPVGAIHELPLRPGEGSTATARVIRYSPNRIDLEISCGEERPMVVAELAAPGWRWMVARASLPMNLDPSRELPAMTANHAFRATRVRAGTHHIALVYQPFSFRLGLYLTMVFVLILGAMVLVPVGERK